MSEQFEQLTPYDVARSGVLAVFNDNVVDPSVEDILNTLLGRPEGRHESEDVVGLRKMLGKLRGILSGWNYPVIVVGNNYYHPITREAHRGAPGAIYPASFRDKAPVSLNEAYSCLAGTGMRFANGLYWPREADDLILLAATQKDTRSATSRFRGSQYRMVMGSLTEEHKDQLLGDMYGGVLPGDEDARAELERLRPGILTAMGDIAEIKDAAE